MNTEFKNKLIVGLDVNTIKKAEDLIYTLSPAVKFFKIGHQLAFTGGLELAKDLIKDGKKVFLDLKLLDIDNTIFKAVENIIDLNIDMLTLHAYPNAMRAAVQAAKNSKLCLLGVTVLTSMDSQDLQEAGYNQTLQELVLKRALQAKECGMGGIVCSALEANLVRNIVGKDMAIVTPGIRLQEESKGDQKRVVTPQDAIKFGASHLVVGRPIIEAESPLENAVAILEKIRQALIT